MVEKQYDILKKERGKGQDDIKIKPDENGLQESNTHIHENGAINKPEVSQLLGLKKEYLHVFFSLWILQKK